MDVHIKTSQCIGQFNIHCLLCPKAMICSIYLSDVYPPSIGYPALKLNIYCIDKHERYNDKISNDS